MCKLVKFCVVLQATAAKVQHLGDRLPFYTPRGHPVSFSKTDTQILDEFHKCFEPLQS